MVDVLHDLRVALLATDGADEASLQALIEGLGGACARVDLIALRQGWLQGLRGLEPGRRFRAPLSIEQVRPDRYDALAIPGGSACADRLRSDPRVLSFVREISRAQKPIAALGHAPWVLISADQARGRSLTSAPSIADDLRNAGAQWIDLPVVSTQNWVTGRGTQDLQPFISEVIATFSRSTPAVITISESA